MSAKEENSAIVAKHEHLIVSKRLDADGQGSGPQPVINVSPAAVSRPRACSDFGEDGHLLAPLDYDSTSKRGQYISSLSGNQGSLSDLIFT
jgi:hypothetical protein